MKYYFQQPDFAEPEEEPAPRIRPVCCTDPRCKGQVMEAVLDESGHYSGQCPSCGRVYLFSDCPEFGSVTYALRSGYPPRKRGLLLTASRISHVTDILSKKECDVLLKTTARYGVATKSVGMKDI